MKKSNIILVVLLLLIFVFFNISYPSSIIFKKVIYNGFDGQDYINTSNGDILFNPVKYEISEDDWVTIDSTKEDVPYYDSFEKYYQIENVYSFVGNTHIISGRFYFDINNNNIPELFIVTTLDSGNLSYLLFEINKKYYRYLGELNFHTLKVLPEKSNNMNDLLLFLNTNTVGNVGEIGQLAIFRNNGTEYKLYKYINHPVSWIAAIRYMRKDYISKNKYITNIAKFITPRTPSLYTPDQDLKYKRWLKN